MSNRILEEKKKNRITLEKFIQTFHFGGAVRKYGYESIIH